MEVLDPKGDLIVVIHKPKKRELLGGIVLTPHKSMVESKAKTTTSAERRRMRRQGLFKNRRLDTQITDIAVTGENSSLEGERGTSSLRPGKFLDNSEEFELAGDNSHAVSATEYNLQPTNDSGLDGQQSLGPLQLEVDEQEVARFRISSSHLRLASAQYRRSLSSAYHGTVNGQLSLEDGTACDVVCMEEWDPNAFLIFLNILHGHNRQVPDSVNIDMLGKLAILVDYYECHERVELFAKRWVEALKGDLPDAYEESVILWIFISWIFGEEAIFKKMTEIALKQSNCPFEADELPLPPMLTENLESERQKALKTLFESVHQLQTDLENGKRGCGEACCCILLGAIIKERKRYKLENSWLWSIAPFPGRSLEESKQVIISFRSPQWCSQQGSYGQRSGHGTHNCTLIGLLRPRIDELWRSLGGLELGDYAYEHARAVRGDGSSAAT